MNENIKTMIQKQIEDAKRGATYRTGIGIEDFIPTAVRNDEKELRDKGKVRCKLFGCHSMSHRTRMSKQCTYHKYRLPSEIRSAMEDNLRSLYPHHYGEFFFLCLNIRCDASEDVIVLLIICFYFRKYILCQK